MANQKISQLTEQTDLSLIDGLAGYEGTSNVRISGPNIISAIPTLYSGDGTIGASRVATITDFPKFSGTQSNPIGLEIENTQGSAGAHTTLGAQLKLTSNSGSSTISFYNGAGGGSSAPAMIINSPTGIRSIAGGTYSSYHHLFSGSTWSVGITNSPLYTSSPKLEMLLGGGGGNGSFYTTKVGGSSDFLYMFMSPGTAGRHIALGEYTNTGAIYKDFLRIDSNGNVGINEDVPTAKLHVKGSGSTNATTSLLVENSLGDDILNIKDDGTFALGKGADSNLASNVCIGSGTTARQESVVIGVASQANSSASRSVALGYACYSNAARAINIGMLSRSTGINSITFATNGSSTTAGNVARQFAVHMSSSSTADFKVIANEGMVPPSITTVTRDAIASPGTGSTIYNTTDNKLQYYDGTSWQSPSSEPYLDVFETSPASPDPLSIYNDGIIQIWIDESASDDIEVQVLTDPAENADVNFTWWSPTAATSGRANINAADGRWQLNAGFNDNDVHQMSVFAPTDTSWPYYEVRIIKTDTAFTGVPAIIRVSKYTI